jgi:hypothetical protein
MTTGSVSVTAESTATECPPFEMSEEICTGATAAVDTAMSKFHFYTGTALGQTGVDSRVIDTTATRAD